MTNTIVVLAAGKGTRMLELSKDKPKQLIHIGNKPFLYYLLSNIRKAGFKNIILVVGYIKAKMEEFTEKYPEFNLILVDQFEKMGTEKYGTAIPVAAAEDKVMDISFVVVNGDDLYSVEDLKKIKETDGGISYVAGFRFEDPSPYGLLRTDKNSFLERIIEKPTPDIDFNSANPMEYPINIGLYHFTQEIFDAIKKIDKSARGEYEITDAITLLAQDKKVKVLPIKGGWKSFTNPDDIAKMEKII